MRCLRRAGDSECNQNLPFILRNDDYLVTTATPVHTILRSVNLMTIFVLIVLAQVAAFVSLGLLYEKRVGEVLVRKLLLRLQYVGMFQP